MRMRTSTRTFVAGFAVLALAETASAYCSPRLGRFLSRDPLNEAGAVAVRDAVTSSRFIPRDPIPGAADAKREADANSYAFNANRAVDRIDPLGLFGGSATLYFEDCAKRCATPATFDPCKLAVVTDHTVRGDVWLWGYCNFQNPNGNHSQFDCPSIQHPLYSGVAGIDAAINHLCNQNCPGGVTELNISGHGNANGCFFADGSRFGPGSLTPAQIARIQQCLSPNGAVVLSCCNTGDNTALLQQFADQLRRRVCGCTGSCRPGPCPQSKRVCRDPTPANPQPAQ